MKFNLKNIKDPFVIILIGPPLSGKTTFIKSNFDLNNVELISRDQIVLDLHDSNDYDNAFKSVNQKKVDDILKDKMKNASINKKNVIIDMTHMSSKRRKFNLSYFGNEYYKLGIIFPILSDEEYSKRNEKRSKEENKTIPMGIVKSMISSYQPISKDIEGFDKVISL